MVEQPAVTGPVDRKGMYEVVGEVLREVIDDTLDSDELLRTESCGPLPTDLRAAYELRYIDLTFSEIGIMGKMSRRNFEGVVRYSLAERLKQLEQEQPNARWIPVAAVISEQNLRKTVTREEGEQADGGSLGGALYAQALATMASAKGQVPIGQVKVAQELPDMRLQCDIAVADLAHGDLRDPSGEHEDGKPGPFEKYALTRNLRQLPYGFRKRRRLAESVIEEFYAERDIPRRSTEERREVPKPEVKETITAAQIGQADALRRDGKTWGEIGELMGVPWQTLKAAHTKQMLAGQPTKVDGADEP